MSCETLGQVMISIHAPHARSDRYQNTGCYRRLCISIHAPHARSDYNLGERPLIRTIFQSTLLMRGATSL